METENMTTARRLALEYADADSLAAALGEMKITDLFAAAEEGGPLRLNLEAFEGLKTQSDIDRLTEALTKERNDHKSTKGGLTPWNAIGKTPEEVTTALDELEELRVKISAMGNPEELDSKVEQLAEGRIKREVAPLQRNVEKLTEERDAAVTRIQELEMKIKTTTLRDTLTQAALKAKVREDAVADAVSLAISEFDIDEDGRILHKESQLDPDAWFVDQKDRRAWMWPTSVGGGAKGGGAGDASTGNNPWHADHWNLTKQGEYIRQHGREKADRLARSVGSVVGATSPPKK